MVLFSKLRYSLESHLPCTILHPWTQSCFNNGVRLFLETFKGTSNFFLLVYLMPLLLKHRNLDYQTIRLQVTIFLRSCLFGGYCGSISMGTMCMLRWLLGRFTTSSLGLIPGIVGGAGIFIEHPSRRTIDLTMFIAFITEVYLRVFEAQGMITMSPSLEFFIFSVSSSLLLYSLRAIRDSYTVMWPLTPNRLAKDPEKRKKCPHKGSCLENIKKSGSAFFCLGMSVQVIKVLALHYRKLFTKPRLVVRALFRLQNLRLPLFAVLYISLFKGVSCLLCQYRQQDEAWYALPAGAIASLCYFLHPNRTLAMLAVSNLSQILCRNWRKKLELPEFPYEELLFMLFMGFLYHARALHPECFPQFMFKIMDTATDGRAKIVYEQVETHLVNRF